MTRTELLLGKDQVNTLRQKHVLIAGLGGVGGYTAEAVCRAGVGELTIVDSDIVKPSNLNRQLLALKSTEEKSKVQLMSQRLMDINPDMKLNALEVYLRDEKTSELLEKDFDFVVDAIDTLSPKIFFIKKCMDRKLPLVSSMGAGGKMDPEKIRIGDISESHGCKFAQVVRKKLGGWGIRSGFKVVYSPEPVPKEVVVVTDNEANKKSTVGTISYMPAMFGLMAASVVIRRLLSKH